MTISTWRRVRPSIVLYGSIAVLGDLAITSVYGLAVESVITMLRWRYALQPTSYGQFCIELLAVMSFLVGRSIIWALLGIIERGNRPAGETA